MEKLSSEEIKSFYNSNYANKLSNQTIYKNKRLLKYIRFEKTESIVDIGCGDGRFAHLIHDQISKYTGVDFSKHFIETADANLLKTNINNACYICEDIISFCKKNPNSFDKAFALDFTEHVYDEELMKIFSAVRESLKVDGILYIHTPNGDYIIEKLKKWGIMKQFPEHIAIRNEKEYFYLLQSIGFLDIKVTFLSHYLKILSFFHVFSFIPFIGKFFKARLLIICQI